MSENVGLPGALSDGEMAEFVRRGELGKNLELAGARWEREQAERLDRRAAGSV